MAERWVAVPGFEGKYEVSDLGRVKRLARTEPYRRQPGGHVRRQAERVLTCSLGSNGYLTVRLNNRTYTVHQLVLIAFVGPKPPGYCACHGPDFSKTNNRLDNLRWDTYAANNAERDMPPLDRSAEGQFLKVGDTDAV